MEGVVKMNNVVNNLLLPLITTPELLSACWSGACYLPL